MTSSRNADVAVQLIRRRDRTRQILDCGSAWKKDPVSGVIGVEQGPLIPMV
jgi:hypothetical protein